MLLLLLFALAPIAHEVEDVVHSYFWVLELLLILLVLVLVLVLVLLLERGGCAACLRLLLLHEGEVFLDDGGDDFSGFAHPSGQLFSHFPGHSLIIFVALIERPLFLIQLVHVHNEVLLGHLHGLLALDQLRQFLRQVLLELI